MLFGQCPNRGGDLLKGASLICFVFHIVHMDTVHSAAGFHVSPTGRGSSGFKITTAEPNLLRRDPKPKFNPFHWEQMNPNLPFWVLGTSIDH